MSPSADIEKIPAELVLGTRGLNKSFGGQQAVQDLDLEVRRGDIYGFLGLNGAGKTTTLRMVLGLLRPDSGTISLFGRNDRASRLAAMSRVGAMVEGPSFYGHLSGGRNLELLGSLSGPLERGRVDEVLRLVGLDQAGGKAARHYSLGMKQRLGIALALVSRPELVILDEPTNGLDLGILEMRRLIQRLNGEGVTFVISSHLLYEIEMICNRIAILERGHLLYEGDTAGFGRTGAPIWHLRAAPIERALALLAERGVTAERMDGDLIEFSAAEDAVPALIETLVHDGLALRSFAEHRPSLEEFFLRSSAGQTEGRLS